MMFNINTVVVATIMYLAALASVDKVCAKATVRRRVKSGKKNYYGPPPPPPKSSKKNSKKNRPTPSPVTPPDPNPVALSTPEPVLPPLSYRPTDVPTTTAPKPEPTDGPTEEFEPLLDIPNTAQEEGYTTLVEALTAADLVDALSFPNGPFFTVMAPTNTAFGLLDEDLLGCLLEPLYQDVLQNVLLYHAADGKNPAQGLFIDQEIEMLNGDNILINIDAVNVVINDNAEVVQPNVIASNGILHGIDRVLFPPGT